VRDLVARISWTQVAALALVIGGAVGALAWTPAATIEKIAAADWRAIGAAVVLVIGALQGTLGGAIVRKREPPATLYPSLPPLSMPPLPPIPETPTAIESPRARRRSETPSDLRPASRREEE
jgi:hypothetical protein